MPNRWIIRILLLLGALLLTACGDHGQKSVYQALDVSRQLEHADFSLTDFNGKPRRLSDFKGNVVVLFFGYTHCPEVCPTTLSTLSRVMTMLGKDANRVQVLFVTVDPERDSPQSMAQLVPSFHPSFLGLYGDAKATDRAAKAFGVFFEKQYYKKGGYTVLHSDGTFLIGTSGRPVLLSRYGQSADLLAQDIRLLLSDTPN